jgi:hypothetical protein
MLNYQRVISSVFPTMDLEATNLNVSKENLRNSSNNFWGCTERQGKVWAPQCMKGPTMLYKMTPMRV